MAKDCDRRRFLTGSLKGAAAVAVTGTAVAHVGLAPGAAHGQHDPAAHGEHGAMHHDPLVDRFPRRHPTIEPSPPPPLSGRQMGVVRSPGLEPLGYELEGRVKVFHLVAQPVERLITDAVSADEMAKQLVIPDGYEHYRPRPTRAKKMTAWGYNGQTPGPTLEAQEGDRVRIVLRNELPEPTSIHWHGFEIPFAQDGAAGYYPFESRRPVLPGETETYEFDLRQSGTLMYHTGFNVMKQEALGLGGLFVVHPQQPRSRPDKEFAILLQQWTFQPGNPNPDVIPMEPSFATFNGLTSPTFPMLDVEQGDRVRIRIGNLSLLYHPIHLHGHVFEIVGTTGGPIPRSARWRDVTVTVGPGESRDLEFVAWNPGTWRMHCHVLHHIMNQMPEQPMHIAPPEGMFTHLRVTPRDRGDDPRNPKTPWSYPAEEERF